jgi:hypothetical protein
MDQDSMHPSDDSTPIESSDREKVIALIDQLFPDQLLQAIEFLRNLAEQTSPEERQLLQSIRQAAPIDCNRLDELHDRFDWETITAEEHDEMIESEALLECWQADRMAAIERLAEMRAIDFTVLYRQLNY